MRQVELFNRMTKVLEENREFAVARLLFSEGSAPQEPGAGMIIFPNGSTEGTIGGGPFEAQVIADALNLIRSGKILHKRYEFTREGLGMLCCGAADVLIETFRRPWNLWIFGGGHVGQALCRMAAQIGIFRMTVFDDRIEYATRERHPDADSVILTDPEYCNNVPIPDLTTFVVIVTRGHSMDQKLVARLSPHDSAYIGMMGSVSKKKAMISELEAQGVEPQHLAKVEIPIGLPLGGKALPEVALSILARLVQVKNELETRHKSSGRD